MELHLKKPLRLRATALVLAASVALVSCSGGGGGGGSIVPVGGGTSAPGGDPQIGTRAGTVQLPAGSHLDVSTLRVSNSLGQAGVSMGGSFAVAAFASGPQLAQVTDANGTPLMAGFLSASEPAIDARTTAEAMIYFAGGLFLLPGELQQSAYDQIASTPGFATVEAAVTADIAAGGSFARTGPALSSFVATLDAQGATHRTPAAAAPADLLVDPSGPQSGITVLNASPIQVSFRNTLRRMAVAFVDQVSYGDASGGTTTVHAAPLPDVVPPTIPIDANLDLAGVWTALATCAVPCVPATTPLKSFNGTLVDLLYGNSAFAEVATPNLTLPSVPGALWTRYRITLVGPGGGGRNISTPLTSEQEAGQGIVSTYFLLTQLLVPLLTGVLLPIGSNLTDAPDPKAQAAVLAEMASVLTSSDPDIALAASNGDMGLAMTRAWTAIISSSTLRTAIVNGILSSAYKDGKLYFDGTTYLNSGAVAEGLAGTLMRAAGAVDILLQGFDASVVGYALATSNSADEVTVFAVPAKVTFSPATSTIDNDAGVHLTASIPSAGGSDLALTYTWRNTAAYGHFKDLGLHGTDNFSSTDNEGIYTANHTGTGTDSLSVDVVALDNSGNKLEHVVLGTGSATVSIATPDPGSVGDPPQEPQSRCASMSASPHVLSIGDTLTGTTSAPHPESCGGGTVTWYWTWGGGVSVVSGCGNTETSCVLRAASATGVPGNRYVQICLQGSSTQGGWDSCDYYAVKP